MPVPPPSAAPRIVVAGFPRAAADGWSQREAVHVDGPAREAVAEGSAFRPDPAALAVHRAAGDAGGQAADGDGCRAGAEAGRDHPDVARRAPEQELRLGV